MNNCCDTKAAVCLAGVLGEMEQTSIEMLGHALRINAFLNGDLPSAGCEKQEQAPVGLIGGALGVAARLSAVEKKLGQIIADLGA